MKATNETNGHESEFQVEGEIITSSYNHRGRITQEKSSVCKKPFVVARKGRSWKIRTADLDFETPFFEEMGCDGNAIYKLRQFDEEALRQKHGHLKNARTASGRIFPCSHPLGMDGDDVFPLWLAFCSSEYLATRSDEQIVSPGYLLDVFSKQPVPPHVLMPAKWQFDNSSFVSKIDWFSEGKELGWSNDDVVEIQSYPPPFDAGGFLYGSFETTKWTEFSGMKLPGGFKLDVFMPNQMLLHPDPTQGELCLSWNIEAKVNAVRSLEKFSCLPELTRKTLITDGRFRGGCCPDGLLSYGSAVWMTEEEVEAKNREHGVKCEKQTSQA